MNKMKVITMNCKQNNTQNKEMKRQGTRKGNDATYKGK